jgi:predicted glycoside hydrolase/deacetylase ChbG (UPF0249 family)
MSITNVILTSDDFGMSAVYNRVMLDAIEQGWLSSISVLVERDIEKQSKQVNSLKELYESRHISLGLHLEISGDENVEIQCHVQWEKFIMVLGKTPDYIDIHKDHLYKKSYDAVAAFCIKMKVPFRKYVETSLPVKSPNYTLNASFTGIDEVIERIHLLQTNEKLEIVFHIGSHDGAIISSLNKERENDLQKLKSVYTEVRNKGIGLINYKML